MERVRCHCNECGASIGDFANLWTQIGKTYFSPLVDLCTDLNVKPLGATRVGEKHTLVGECELQDIACTSCLAVLGLRCLSTPVNHVLGQDHILLRLTSITPLDSSSGQTVELDVKRFLRLRGTAASRSDSASNTRPSPSSSQSVPEQGPLPPRPWRDGSATGYADVPDISQIQADLEEHRDDIDRLDSAGYRIVSAFDNAVNRVEGEVGGLRDFVKELKRDLSGNQDDLASLKADLRDVKSMTEDNSALARLESRVTSALGTISTVKADMAAVSMQFRKDLGVLRAELLQVRQDLADAEAISGEKSSAIQKHTSELEALRRDIASLKSTVDHDRSKHSGGTSMAFPSRELDILTSNIAKIGNRASLVETLQMEFDMLKGRVERMESGTEAHGAVQLTNTIGESGVVVDSSVSEKRKRRISRVKAHPGRTQELTRRISRSPEVSDASNQEGNRAAGRRRATSPTATSLIPEGRKKPRLNKSDAVDGRSLRRTTRKKQ